MEILLNGINRAFPDLSPGASLQHLIDGLGLKGDRIAVERNGAIVPRPQWTEIALDEGDKLEIVHFVGGGLA